MFNPLAPNPWVRRLATQRSKATESSCGIGRAAKRRSKTWCPQSSLCRSRSVGLRELSFGPNLVARARFFRKVDWRPRARGHVASLARPSSPIHRLPVNDAALPCLSSGASAMITRFFYSTRHILGTLFALHPPHFSGRNSVRHRTEADRERSCQIGRCGSESIDSAALRGEGKPATGRGRKKEGQ